MDRLSDEILIAIVIHVPLKDCLFSVQFVNSSLHRIVWHLLKRNLHLKEQYWMTNKHLKHLLKNKQTLTTLSLCNCYWLSTPVLKSIKGCTSLTTLNLVGCHVTGKALLHILSGTNMLKDLSFTASLSSISQIRNEARKWPGIELKLSLVKLYIHFEDCLRGDSEVARIFASFVRKLFKPEGPIESIFIECNIFRNGFLMVEHFLLSLSSLIEKAENFYISYIKPPMTCIKALQKVGVHISPNLVEHHGQTAFITHRYSTAMLCQPTSKPLYSNLCYLYLTVIGTPYIGQDNVTVAIIPEIPTLEYLAVVRISQKWIEFSEASSVSACKQSKLKRLDLSALTFEQWEDYELPITEVALRAETLLCHLKRHQNLVELNLCGAEIDGDSFYAWLGSDDFPVKLQSIALSIHTLCMSAEHSVVTSSGRPKKRAKFECKRNGLLFYLHKRCPNLQELEIYGNKPLSSAAVYMQWWKHNYAFYESWPSNACYHFEEISLFENLKKLSLFWFHGLIDFFFMKQIAIECKQLESLRFAHLGLPSNANYIVQVQYMMRNLPNLKEISLWHDHIFVSVELLQAASNCLKLEKLNLQSRKGEIHDKAYGALLRTISRCKELVHVAIIASQVSATQVKQVEKTLKSKYATRPALRVVIYPYEGIFGRLNSLEIPMRDMMRLESKVAKLSPRQLKF